jgi:isovaleryl-CoA dehydrogenase
MNKQLRNDTALPTHFMTEEQQALADQAGKFFMSEFHHLNAEMDDTDDLPPSVFPKLGEMGYLGLNVPPEFGGAGLDFTSACIITEQLSRSSAAIGLTHVAHDNLCVNNIYRNANDDLRRKYLPGLCDGTLIGALGLTEPGAGSDALGSMRTTAKKDGDDYILNGSKIYITNGPIADLVLVYAKTSPEKGAKGISAFIVETDTPGFKVAQKLNKMGFRGSPTGELVFEDCQEYGRQTGWRRCRDDVRAGSGTCHRLLQRNGHCAAGAGYFHRLRQDTAAIRQADRQFPDGAGDAGRHVHPDRGGAQPVLAYRGHV